MKAWRKCPSPSPAFSPEATWAPESAGSVPTRISCQASSTIFHIIKTTNNGKKIEPIIFHTFFAYQIGFRNSRKRIRDLHRRITLNISTSITPLNLLPSGQQEKGNSYCQRRSGVFQSVVFHVAPEYRYERETNSDVLPWTRHEIDDPPYSRPIGNFD